MFCSALEDCGAEPTREQLISAFTAMGTRDFGGIELVFGAGDNQGLDQVFLTELDASGAKPLGGGFTKVSE